tara:strand:+ start:239 stop:976 length:738 start_codon:yes stop_codon:yes gene_type:complete
MEIKVIGYVEVTLKDKDGNIVAQDCGYNEVTEMSNNILMDAIIPRLGTTNSVDSVPARPIATALSGEFTGMSANSDDIYGSNYVGPAGANTNTSKAHSVNSIAYIAVGTNVGATDSTHSNMLDSDFHSTATPAYKAFTAFGDDGNSDAKNVRRIDSIDFPVGGKSVKFTTQFGTGEGNLATNIREIGIWTAGSNADADGFINDNVKVPTAKTDMRLFARRILSGDGITKTNDGTLDISYTITFSA